MGWSEREVAIPAGDLVLPGDLEGPSDPVGVVAFAHGSGSTRRSPRNRLVASLLRDRGLATLRFDLLSPEEGRDRSNVFDIRLLASRLRAATTWLREEMPEPVPIGYFGASTGAAAALWAAAELGREISAVVSRGGRPDLAGSRLGQVSAPTLLIVGGNDPEVRDLNVAVRGWLGGESDLQVIPGASHLFEEPGALEQVAELAGAWFERHLGRAGARARPR